MPRLASFRYTLLCVASFLLFVLIAHPVVNGGMVDDWSYVWTAKRLAETGHLEYNGWANAMLGWELYAGALFAKLFGFSWTIVRMSVMLIAACGLALSHRIFLRLGCTPREAAIITLGLACNSIFFLNSVIFMSDVPGWAAIVVCLYSCVRAYQADTDRATIFWIAFAGFSNVFLGTVRQVAWLGALILVPCVVWSFRNRTLVFKYGCAIWLVSLAGVAYWMHWWNHVPYAVHERMFFFHRGQIAQAPSFTLTLFAQTTPVLFAFLLCTPRRWVPATGIVLGAIGGWFSPWLASYWGVSAIGPEIFPKPYVGAVVAAVVFGASFAFLDAAWTVFRKRAQQKASVLSVGDRNLFWLAIPYALALIFLLYTRGALWPRYWLPMLPMAGIGILWIFRRWSPGSELPAGTFVLIFFVYLAAVIATRTAFAEANAYLGAESEYLQAGYSRDQLQAGFASDGLREIRLRGYINDYRITTPSRVYVPLPDTLPVTCLEPMAELFPSIDRRYSLQEQYGGCFQPMGLPPVEYRSWIPPFRRYIYITKITPSMAPPRP